MTYNEEAPLPGERETGREGSLGNGDEIPIAEEAARRKPSPATFGFVPVLHGQQEVTLTGRNAWTLRRLIERGNRGLTAAECPPGLRLAALVHRLRQAHIPIDATTERHEGQFAGHHARYRLAASVQEL